MPISKDTLCTSTLLMPALWLRSNSATAAKPFEEASISGVLCFTRYTYCEKDKAELEGREDERNPDAAGLIDFGALAEQIPCHGAMSLARRSPERSSL